MAYITELNPLTNEYESIPIREDGSGDKLYLTVDGSSVYYSHQQKGTRKRGIGGKPYYVLSESLSYSRGGWTARETRNDDIGLIDSDTSSSYTMQETVSRSLPTQSRVNFRMPKMTHTKKFPNPIDIVIYLVMGVEIFIVINLIIYSMFSGDLSEEYNSLTGNRASNFDKKLAFVSSLVSTTGIADYATSIGFTAEEAEQMMKSNAFSTGYKDPETGDPATPPGPENPLTPWTDSNWETAVATHNKVYEPTGSILKTTGWKFKHGFLVQSQSGDSYWSEAGNDGNTLKDKGCLWFTLATIITNVKGQVYGVENLLADVGYTVDFVNGKWRVSPTIGKVGVDSTYRHPGGSGTVPSTPAEILSKCSAGITVSSETFNTLKTDTFAEGTMYLVHITGDTQGKMASTTNQEHWFIIYGISGTDFLIGNGGGQAASTGKGSISYAEGKLNHIYKVVSN